MTSFGCEREERARPPATELPIADTQVTRDDDTGNTPGVDSALAITDSGTSDSTASSDSTTTPDLGPPPDVTIIDKCAGPYAAFSTQGLVASGMTPKAFATAYNKEVLALKHPGPMLLAFKGVDSSDSSKWKLKVGGLDHLGSGPEVRFFGPAVEVNYTKGIGITLSVAEQLASFKLHFDKNDLPVSAIRMTATAGDCTEISIDSLVVLIPESAKDEAFGGSTVGALMGAPATGGAGGGVWFLELLGSDKKATIGGGGP